MSTDGRIIKKISENFYLTGKIFSLDHPEEQSLSSDTAKESSQLAFALFRAEDETSLVKTENKQLKSSGRRKCNDYLPLSFTPTHKHTQSFGQ